VLELVVQDQALAVLQPPRLPCGDQQDAHSAGV
jgi:hypothetical protein